MATPRDTVEWREALALLALWQEAPAEQRGPLLQRLCEEHPAAASALHELVASLQRAGGTENTANADDTEDAEGAFLSNTSMAFGAGTAAAMARTARAGSVCGRWTLERPLGSGGMGEVWLARRNDGLHEGMAAIKLLHAGPRTALTEARFAAEGRVLARLEHPHIARLLDVGIDSDGQRFIVLEHVAGEPITAWCGARHTPLAGRLELFLQVCDAVAHAHAQLVVHRDIKPSNILVTADGQAKLLDFGIAKLLDDESGALTRAGMPALTPDYAAPEQLLGGPISVATDVHALGGLLFELLTGARPHGDAASGAEQRLRAALDDSETRQPSRMADATLAPLLRGDIDHIVERALRRLPAERYPSVRALADDVQRHLRHEPVSVRAPSWRYRLAKFVRRHRAGVLGGSFALLALLAGSAAALWQASRAQEAARQAREEAAVANATREFLLGLFRDVKVGQAGLKARLEGPVRDLVIEGGRQLLDDRQLTPPVRLDLLRTIAQLHARLSLNDSAERLHSEAVSVALAVHGADNDITLSAKLERGSLLRQLGRYADATAQLSEVVTAAERLGRTDSLVLARALHELGDAALHAADAAASTHLPRALALFDRHHPNHPERVSAHITWMRWHRRSEDFPAFDQQVARIDALVAQGIAGPAFDRFYYERSKTSRWLAAGDHARAWATLSAAIPAAQESQGPRHPMVIVAQRYQVLLEQQLGDRASARRRLLALDQAPQDIAVWSAGERDRSHADLDWFDGDIDSARNALQRELAKTDMDLDERHLLLLRWALVETLLGHSASALAAAQSAFAALSLKPGPGSLLQAQARGALGEAQALAGQLAAAASTFNQLLTWADARRAAPAGPLVQRLRARALLGLSALQRAADPAAALERATAALEGLPAEAPALDDRLLWSAARISQAQALQASGRRQEAAAAAASAVAQLERDQLPTSPRLAHAKGVLVALR